MKRIENFKRWLVRLQYRWRCWQDLDAALNRRAEVEATLFYFAGAGRSCPPEECKRLALKLGVPSTPQPREQKP